MAGNLLRLFPEPYSFLSDGQGNTMWSYISVFGVVEANASATASTSRRARLLLEASSATNASVAFPLPGDLSAVEQDQASAPT